METVHSNRTCQDLDVRLPQQRTHGSEPFGHADHPVRGFFHRLARLLVITGLCLIVLAVLGGFSAVVGIGPGCGEDSKPSEARAALGAVKDRARVVYQRSPESKTINMKDLGLGARELSGSYFKEDDFSCGGTPKKWWAECRNVYDSEPRNLRVEVDLVGGSATFNR